MKKDEKQVREALGKEIKICEEEEGRKKDIMKERAKLRRWGPGWANQIRVQILGDSSLIVHWMTGRWKINNQKFKAEVHETPKYAGHGRVPRQGKPYGIHFDLDG